jgi:hypothetical protein
MSNEPVPRSAPSRFRLAAGMTWRRWLIDILLIAGGVVSVLFEPFSIAIHSIVGLAFAGTVGPHLWYRRAWIRGTLSRMRQRQRLSVKLRWSLGQAVLLTVLVIVVTVSGLLDWLGAPVRIKVHGLASLVLIGVVSRHAWTRRSWLTRRRRTANSRVAGDTIVADAKAPGR